MTASPLNEGLSIDFSPVKVPPSLTTPTLVALVTFRRKLADFILVSYYIMSLSWLQPARFSGLARRHPANRRQSDSQLAVN